MGIQKKEQNFFYQLNENELFLQLIANLDDNPYSETSKAIN